MFMEAIVLSVLEAILLSVYGGHLAKCLWRPSCVVFMEAILLSVNGGQVPLAIMKKNEYKINDPPLSV